MNCTGDLAENVKLGGIILGKVSCHYVVQKQHQYFKKYSVTSQSKVLKKTTFTAVFIYLQYLVLHYRFWGYKIFLLVTGSCSLVNN